MLSASCDGSDSPLCFKGPATEPAAKGLMVLCVVLVNPTPSIIAFLDGYPDVWTEEDLRRIMASDQTFNGLTS